MIQKFSRNVLIHLLIWLTFVYTELAVPLPYLEISDRYPEDAVTVPGKHLRLRCPNGLIENVNTSIQWFRNDIKLSTTDIHHTLLPNETLSVMFTKPGLIEYRCSLTYRGINLLEPMVILSRVARVRIVDHAGPVFTQQPGNVTVGIEGSIAYIGCNPSSHGRLLEFWLEKEIEDRFVYYFNNRTATLPHGIQIYPLHLSDYGRYRCGAIDKLGRSYSLPTDLVVTSKIGYQALEFVSKPSAVNASINATVIIECSVIGNPTPKIQWKKDHATIHIRESSKYTIVHGNNLRISHVTLSDRGNYYCIASQLYKNTTQSLAHFARLNVHVRPEINTSIPKLINGKANHSYNLTCRILAGNPRPVVKWFRNGELINATKDHSMQISGMNKSTITVRFDQLYFPAIYQCFVDNGYGVSQTSFQFTPSNITCQRPNWFSPNLRASRRFYYVGDHANFSCPDQLTSSAYNTTVCKSSGVWSKSQNFCLGNCSKPDLKYATIYGTFNNGDSIFIKCFTGYYLSGGNKLTCINGKWVHSGNIACQSEETMSFKKSPANIVIARKLSKKLFCQPNSDAHSILWYKDGHNLDSSCDFRIENDGLLLKQVKKSCSGFYQCRIISNHTELSILSNIASVNVAYIDSSLKRRPKNISKAALGSNVKFSCTARSYPKATYVWYKDGSAVSQTVRRIITETGELVISELRASDVGQYHCIAQNYLGYAKSTFAKLHIDESLKLSDVKFAWLVKPSSQMINRGDSINITCLSTHGNASVVWMKDDEFLKSDTQRFFIGKTSLRIINAKEADNGTYECIILHGHQSLQGQVSIIVKSPLKFENMKNVNVNVRKKSGDNFTLTCAAVGIPKPVITWYKNGNVLRSNIRYSIKAEKATLTLIKLRITDTGIYQCFVSNEIEVIKKTFSLFVLPVNETSTVKSLSDWESLTNFTSVLHKQPGKPYNFVVEASTTSITLTWTRPSDERTVSYYIIQCYSGGLLVRSINYSINIDAVKLSKKINDLILPNNYKFVLSACNLFGCGPFSETTLASLPRKPGIIKNLRITLLTHTDVSFQWDPVSESDKIISFIVKIVWYGSNGNLGNVYETILIPKDYGDNVANMYLRSKLPNDATVSVQMAAVNAYGNGSFSTVSRAVMQNLPGVTNITLAVVNLSIVITWIPLSDISLIKSYNVRWKLFKAKRKNSVKVNSSLQSFTLTNLTALDYKYQIQIEVRFRDGQKTRSKWKEIFLPSTGTGGLPGSVQRFNCKYLQGNNVTCSWLPPLSYEVTISGYVLGWESIKTYRRKEVHLNSSISQFIITQLEVDQNYNFDICAKSSSRNGPPAYFQLYTNPVGNGVFSAPTHVSVKSASSAEEYPNNKSVVATWRHEFGSLDHKKENETYVVYLRYFNGSKSDLRRYNTFETRLTIPNLLPFYTYQLSVRFFARGISSAFSPWAEFQTNYGVPTTSPDDVTIIDDSPTSVRVCWQPPSFSGGVITEYLILYSTDKLMMNFVKLPVYNGNLCAHVTKLSESTEYFFRVSASTGRGAGPFTENIRKVTRKATVYSPSVTEPYQATGSSKTVSESVLFYIIGGVISGICLILMILSLLFYKYSSKRSRVVTKRNSFESKITADANTDIRGNEISNRMQNVVYRDSRRRLHIDSSQNKVVISNQSNFNTEQDILHFERRFRSLADNVRVVDNVTEDNCRQGNVDCSHIWLPQREGVRDGSLFIRPIRAKLIRSRSLPDWLNSSGILIPVQFKEATHEASPTDDFVLEESYCEEETESIGSTFKSEDLDDSESISIQLNINASSGKVSDISYCSECENEENQETFV